MKITILVVVFNFSFCLGYAPSPVYNNLCKRTGGSTTCYQNDTWGFDERTRKCYHVPKHREPCGFFDGKKGCKDFCSRPFG